LDKGIDKSQIDQAISDLDSSDKEVRCNAFNSLLARVRAKITWHDLTRISNKLVELASSSDVEIRQRIGSMCNDKICNTNPELALTLAMLSEAEGNTLRSEIKSNLDSIGSNYPIKCLEIIQRWLRTNVLQIGSRLPGILHDIPDGDARIVDRFLRSWIEEEEDDKILMFGLPDLLQEMFYHSDKKRLVDLLDSTNLNDERQLMVVCRTLKQVLGDQINIKQMSPDQKKNPSPYAPDFIHRCFEFVSKLAKSKDIDIAKIEPGETQLNRTLAIVDSIENLRRKVDSVTVQQNLKYCPTIKDLLGQQWFDKMIARKDTSHPLILLLGTKEPSGFALLEYIDKIVEILNMDNRSKLGKIKQAFENPSQFFPTVGELVVYAHFRSLYNTTEIEHNVEEKPANRPVDCKVETDGTKILFEVASLELPAPLKYGTIMANVPNRAKVRLVQDKLKKQIPAVAAAAGKAPIFVVLNTTRGRDIDDSDIQDLLYGSLQLSPVFGESRKVRGFIVSRAKDSINEVSNGKQISGIIHCQMDFDTTDCKWKLVVVDIYKNSDAMAQVDEWLIERMKDALFNRPLA
jgi:hypothetical protein